MADFSDLVTAAQAVVDPSTSAADLAQIAQLQPGLRANVASHPNVYPGLVDWLARQGITPPAQSVAQSSPLAASPVQPVAPLASTSVPMASMQPAVPYAPDLPSGQWGLVGAPRHSAMANPSRDATQPARRKVKPWLVAVIGILVVAVVVALVMVFRSGGNAGPGPSAPWAKVYGGSGGDDFSAAAIAQDGTIIAVGSTSSSDGDFPFSQEANHGAPVIAKVARDGSLVWAKTAPDGGCFDSVVIASDGDAVCVGGGVAKFDASGTVVWDVTSDAEAGWFESGSVDDTAVAATSDGGVVIAGTDMGDDAVIAKLGSDGSVLWTKVLGSLGGGDLASGWLNSVAVAHDGSIIVAGSTGVNSGIFAGSNVNENGGDAFVAKLSSAGDVTWVKTFGGNDDDEFTSVAAAPDGSIAVAGDTSSTDGDFPANPGDAVVAKINSDGSLAWAHTYGMGGDDRFESVAVNSSGEFLVAGGTWTTDGADQAVVAKYDQIGNQSWVKTYGGAGGDWFEGLALAPNGVIVAVGNSDSIDGDFPAKHGATPSGPAPPTAFDPTRSDAVVVALTADGSLSGH